MLELTFGFTMICLAAWGLLDYLDNMGRLQKRMRRDDLMRMKCKALANNYVEEDSKFTCVKCTDIKEKLP